MSRFDRIGEVIADRRRQAGLSQKELARRAGISAPQLNKYEKARSVPNLSSLGKVVDALGLGLGELERLLDEVNGRPHRRRLSEAGGEPLLAGGDLERYLDTDDEIPPAVRPTILGAVRALRSATRQIYRDLVAGRQG